MEKKMHGSLNSLYKEELLHTEVYRHLAKYEKNEEIRQILISLSAIESKHASLWKKLINTKGIKESPYKVEINTLLLRVIRRIFGLLMTVKVIEYRELILYQKLENVRSLIKDKEEIKIIKEIEADEITREFPLIDKIASFNPIINNIRDITFGMNDGLVEVLAATVGLGAALQNPLLVLMGGLIVAVSGTASMAGGAYLATEYEQGTKKIKTEQKSAIKSAFYVGVPYIIGAIFPLLPFILGYGGSYGIIFSMMLTIIVLAINASIIAILTNVSISRRVITTLAISIGAALIAILLGYYARAKLHLSI